MRQQKTTETREQYLSKARRYCADRLVHHNEIDPHCHESHNVARAMEDTEKRYVDLGTFGVEGDCALNGEGCIDIQYLNAGDTYETTIVYYRGRLMVTSWGDIVETQE